MSYFKPLREELWGYLDKQEIRAVHSAYLLALKAHGEQKRHTGEPYITHPVAVATILAELRLDYQTIMAALLHDVIEDTAVTKKMLLEQFGQDIAELVDGVSKLEQLSSESREIAQAENLRKMILAMAKDIRVILIKLADRLHNMRTLGALPSVKRRRIAKETLEIYAPIANRLGMHTFRLEFEELGFANLYPERYRVLRQAVRRARGNRREIMATIEQALRSSLDALGIVHYELSGREKHLYSIFKKMRQKRLSFSEVMDIYGFRIVTDNVDSCYRILGVSHSLYKPIPQRFKDYIAIPKANNYQSLHTTLFGPYGVPVEIQIRTQEMNRLADSGVAAHWIYKSDRKDFSDAHLQARDWIRSVMEMQERANTSIEFLENVKTDLFPDEVYLFTPKGDIMKLPQGVTGVDFAYAVHSHVGNTCMAVKIDRHLAPLSMKLESGQTVEIITSPKATPNPAWLNFVVTGKARSGIRHFLKTQKRKESLLLGERLLHQAMASVGLQTNSLSKKQQAVLLMACNQRSIEDVYADIALGHKTALSLAELLVDSREAQTELSAPQLSILGTEGAVMHYAPCCRPIPGDTIIGIFELGQGIAVHREECARLSVLQPDHEKWMSLRWENSIHKQFPVDILLRVENRYGILASVTAVIADAESNIDSIEANNEDGNYFMIRLTISVRDRKHFADILRALRRITGLLRVTRVSQAEAIT